MAEAAPWVIVALFPFFFAGLWVFVTFLIALVSGWRTLAEWYRGEPPEDAPKKRATWAAMGRGWFKASFRNVLALHVAPGGFAMRVFVLFRMFQPTLVIPRGDVEVVAGRMLFTEVYRIRFARAPGVELVLPGHVGQWLESQGAIPKASRPDAMVR